ncbi:hypothetical protein [Halanaerobacter jeridensis]|uniref:Uncharacterized protein n=1 Tax=Halanaerobacter jeridensis TaxID=706427 RepID=A0A939BPF0_9FIRM|nr:hypothetical protein [Halanaerobacter jeridensis]MBM7556748.1 hypothetical protein [Halanaerobacter jeridensis]
MNLQKLLQDPLIRGGLAGTIAGIIMELINYPIYYLKYLKIRPTDFSYMVITHHKADSFLEITAGFINHLFFASVSGIILSYILLITNYRFPIIKGITLGLGTNIILLVLGSFFNIKSVINISPVNILLLDISAALAFGITLGLLMKYFQQSLDLNTENN